MRASVAVFLLAWFVLATSNEESEEDVHFTNSWAVHIENDDIEAVSDIANKHGFVNQGQIGSLPGYYHFVKHTVGERSRRSLDEHSQTLLSEPRVKWAEQQRILERSKRDVIPGEDELVERSVARLRRDNAVTIHDPFYRDQWYLQNIGQSSGPHGIDINVLPVWAQGYSGKGVVVSVLDDGVDHTHPDLKTNYDPDASFDFNDFDGDPKPHDENLENCHGTKCAGEVAAQADNGICGVGVSFNASIGGIRMLDGKATDTLEGSSLSYRADYIDIYSCCWGPKDDGKRFGKPGYLASKALQIGAQRGRGGKGNIYVWATGNGGLTDDDCNCDGYTTSIYTISIGAISDHGLSTYYTETCASTLAVTFSGGSHRETVENKVVTTDLHHKCTEVFKGTSSAAPLAAGMLALVLEANPKLTWRDVQHVIVESSQVTSPLDEGWKINGAGKRYNHKFGFGRLDVSKMVDKALKWKNVDKQRVCHGASHNKARYIPASGSLILSANTSACSSTASEIRKVEHVQLNVTLQHRHRGDISITLISPSGTRSELLTTRRNDHSARGVKNWVFMTVHCWGEDPRGLWTVIVTDNDNNNRKHYLKKLTQGDEEDVTRIFLDDTGKHRQTENSQQRINEGHAPDHVMKTMEDTAGKLFNGNGFSKFVQGKKPQHIRYKQRPTVMKKKVTVRLHDKKTKETKLTHLKKHYWKTEQKNKIEANKAKKTTTSMARKKIHGVAKNQKDKNSSKKNKASKNMLSKPTFKHKHEKVKATSKKKVHNENKMLKPPKSPEQELSKTSTVVPLLVKTLNKSSVSMFRNLNTSDSAKALDLITKLISEIQKNPLVSKIAVEALKNPAIGKLFGIDSSTNVAEKIEKSLSLTKSGEQTKDAKNKTNIHRSSLSISNETNTQKEKLDTRIAHANNKSNDASGKEPLKHFKSRRPATASIPKHRGIQFFKILKDTQENVVSGGGSGSRSEESGSFIGSESGQNPDGSGSGNVKSLWLQHYEVLRYDGSKNCSGTQKEDASMSGSGQSITKIPKELDGKNNLFKEIDEDRKESQFGDGDGEDFFENVKKAVEDDEEDILPEFGADLDNANEYDTGICSNFSMLSSNDSSSARKLHCPENQTRVNERDKEDKTLAHYLAVDKLKSTSGDNDLDSHYERDDRSPQSQPLKEDKNLNNDRDYTDSKYNGKDLEVLQEALEDQLSRLSKDPNSQKSNAELLARVRDDINHGDIDDLELLEAQITDGKTDISRVVRSLSPEEEKIDDMDDYVDTPPESYEEFNDREEELERRRISHQVQKQTSSQTYYVDPDKYGNDNSGILESWTLILYGTK